MTTRRSRMRPGASRETALDGRLALLRSAYDAISVERSLLTRVARAVRLAPRETPVSPARRRARAALGLAASLVLAFAGGVAAGLARSPAATLPTQAPASALDAFGSAARVPRSVDARARFDALVASATALPQPDDALRAAWIAALFDDDSDVRELARWLLAEDDRGRDARGRGDRGRDDRERDDVAPAREGDSR